MNTFRDIIEAWPSRTALGRDLGVSQQAITNMIARDSVPARYWRKLICSAEQNGISGISLDLLAAIASREDRVEAAE